MAPFLLVACASESPERQAPRTGADDAAWIDAVDRSIPPAVAGADGWNYVRTADADLDGDGSAEKVVLTARVELYNGEPAWDDGQPWQVYVERSPEDRRYIYSQRLQLGTLTLRVATGTSSQPPAVVLIEHLPDRVRLLEAIEQGVTGGEGALAVRVAYERALDPRGEASVPDLP